MNTKTIFQLCSEDWDKMDSEAKERAATQMAKNYKDMVDSIRAALQRDPNDVSAKEAAASIEELGATIAHLIENLDGKDIAEKVGKVASSCLGVTESLNAESKRNQALDDVTKDLGNLAADLETSIMFTTAGIFNPHGEQMPFSSGIFPNSKSMFMQYLFSLQREVDCQGGGPGGGREEDRVQRLLQGRSHPRRRGRGQDWERSCRGDESHLSEPGI